MNFLICLFAILGQITDISGHQFGNNRKGREKFLSEKNIKIHTLTCELWKYFKSHEQIWNEKHFALEMSGAQGTWFIVFIVLSAQSAA